jgi:outer membrane immunogenic protein
MRKTLLASVSAAVLSSSAVMAADMPTKARSMPASTPTWTGFYVGLNAGYAWGNSDPSLIADVTVQPFFFGGTTAAPPSLKPRGFIGGGQAGYNWQMGQWLFGGEIDFSGLSAQADASLSPFFVGKGGQAVTWSSKYDWLFTARLRGGFLVAPNWLLYATGGLAVTHVKDSIVCNAPPGGQCATFASPQVVWSESKTLAGGTIGGGIETMFAPNWTARVEYLFAKFKQTSPPNTFIANVGDPTTTALPPLSSFNHNLNVVRFAINYKFNP